MNNHFTNEHPIQCINESETQQLIEPDHTGFESEFNPFENTEVDPEVIRFKWKDSVKLGTTETGSLVKVHKKKISLSGNGKMRCPKCGNEFQSKGALRRNCI